MKPDWTKLEPLIRYAEDRILEYFIEIGDLNDSEESVLWDSEESVLWACIQAREGKRGRVKVFEYLRNRIEEMNLMPAEEQRNIGRLSEQFGYNSGNTQKEVFECPSCQTRFRVYSSEKGEVRCINCLKILRGE